MTTTLAERIDAGWADDILPTLTDYITIPNVSKAFDADWEANGLHGARRSGWSATGARRARSPG